MDTAAIVVNVFVLQILMIFVSDIMNPCLWGKSKIFIDKIDDGVMLNSNYTFNSYSICCSVNETVVVSNFYITFIYNVLLGNILESLI